MKLSGARVKRPGSGTTRPRERAPQQHGDELADGRPQPLGLVDAAIRGAQRIGRPLGRIVGIVGGPAAGWLAWTLIRSPWW